MIRPLAATSREAAGAPDRGDTLAGFRDRVDVLAGLAEAHGLEMRLISGDPFGGP